MRSLWDEEIACEADSYSIKTGSLKRPRNYGSQHYDEIDLAAQSATLQQDGRTARLEIKDLASTIRMGIACDLETVDGDVLRAKIHGTIHKLR